MRVYFHQALELKYFLLDIKWMSFIVITIITSCNVRWSNLVARVAVNIVWRFHPTFDPLVPK